LDKLRLFLQFFLTVETELTHAELENFISALNAAGADTSAVQHVKAVRQLSRMSMLSATTAQTPQTSQFGMNMFKGRLKGINLGLGADAVLAGLKSYMPKNSAGSLTQLTHALMDPATASRVALSTTHHYLSFDPLSRSAPISSQSAKSGFTEGIVFVVGGGSMSEHSNLEEWSKSASKRIVYGSTAFNSPNDFLRNDLSKLGKEQ
jgi:hypothetical protein